MPQLSELQGRNYFISVTSHNGSVQYIRRRQIFFGSDSLGFLLVKTDKPIYKPEQEGERGHQMLGKAKASHVPICTFSSNNRCHHHQIKYFCQHSDMSARRDNLPAETD